MKTIVLIDLLKGGHRTAFMRLFAKACLEINVRVICCYPDIQEIKVWMEVNVPLSASNIFYEEYKPSVNFHNNKQIIVSLTTLSYWKNCAKFLNNIEKKHSVKIDLVYFNWIDSQMTRFMEPHLLDFIFPYKWSGLYFHPTLFRINDFYLNQKISFKDLDSIFLAKNCVAVTIHDEGILNKYQNRIGKKVLLFPEISDNTLPNLGLPLPKKIKEKANGRTIIGIIGLEPYKGFIALIKLANKLDTSKYFFVFTGVFYSNHLSVLSVENRQLVENFIQNLPENCLWQTGALQEGEEYNSVFCSFDIIYIMYKNFYSSSNRLTKAAVFHKLVLGNNYGCVGDDIPTCHLGETADEDNIEEQAQKLEILKNKILSNNLPFEQWKLYAEKHSTHVLKEKFEELLFL